MPDTLASQLTALIGPEEEWPDEVKAAIECIESDPDNVGEEPCPIIGQPCFSAALLAVAGMVKRLEATLKHTYQNYVEDGGQMMSWEDYRSFCADPNYHLATDDPEWEQNVAALAARSQEKP